jgi:alpha/beta superfamily hydrolase
LVARQDLPSGPVRAYALFAHCFTCTKDNIAARHIAAKRASLGIAALTFDFTGLGSSEGEFQNTNFSSNVGDLIAAADHLRNLYQATSIFVGHSLGGAAVLAAAHQIPEAHPLMVRTCYTTFRRSDGQLRAAGAFARQMS